ncbi:MAG TPA: hypothetical protein PKE69_18205 [Pyrinomonadaceae bacterium]|nr:hypothetical protein [Pyrinomonadaceae bacterium]
MGLTTRPSKNIDLTKIDEIQSEFFDDDLNDKEDLNNKESSKIENKSKTNDKNTSIAKSREVSDLKSVNQSQKTNSSKINTDNPKKEIKTDLPKVTESGAGSLKIADLLATEKTHGVRHSSRPYTVPRSLTIDLTRLKSKFRSRSLQYTQNELMDKMLGESLEIITADNFLELREKALDFVKSPDQCSRRSVTLTEETVSEMNELKADLALKYNRRFSADEIFITLLAVAFLPLYENDLL